MYENRPEPFQSSCPPQSRSGFWRKLAGACFLAGLVAAGSAAGQDEYTDADAAAAQRLAKRRCAKCHGGHGRGVSPEYASLAGQPAEYLQKQLFNFSAGQRRNEKMQEIVLTLTARETFILSEYFSRLRPGSTPSGDEATKARGRRLYFQGNPETGAYNCVSCHGVYATGGGLMPRLAGQNPLYLENQLKSLISRSRGNDRSMHYINEALTPAEVRALAVYLAAEE